MAVIQGQTIYQDPIITSTDDLTDDDKRRIEALQPDCIVSTLTRNTNLDADSIASDHQ